jgi:hypothetical protein
VVYEHLLGYVNQEKAKITDTTSFMQWQSCNHQVMLYIQAFFLSYMLYTSKYRSTHPKILPRHNHVYGDTNVYIMCHLVGTDVHEKCLFVPDKLKKVEKEICLFNASLLNGGQLYVWDLFDGKVEKLQNALMEADDNDLQNKVCDAIWDWHDALSIELA